MRSIAKSVLMLMLAAIAASAVATTAAQAQEGPFWDMHEERLEEGGTEELKEVAKTSLKLEAKGGVITCTKAKLAAGATLVGSSGENGGTSKETIEYSGCSVTGNGAGCKVEGEKFTTTALKSTLGYANEKKEGPVLEKFQPAVGTTIAEPTFGGTCTVKTTKITGSYIGEMPNSESETTEKELKFTKAEKTIWTEASGKLTSSKGGLEAFGGPATEETTDELDTKQPVAILLAWPVSVCNKAYPEGTTKCKAGTYFLEGETFKLQNLGKVEITATEGASIKCGESGIKLKLGKNPNPTKPVVTETTEMTFGNCEENIGMPCTLTTPAGGGTAFPWQGAISWVKSSTTGFNGFLTMRTVSIKAKCGMNECSYTGAGISTSIPGAIYNANDTNKPAASERAVMQFQKVMMTSGIMCSGLVEFSGNYSITPTEAGTDMYVAST